MILIFQQKFDLASYEVTIQLHILNATKTPSSIHNREKRKKNRRTNKGSQRSKREEKERGKENEKNIESKETKYFTTYFIENICYILTFDWVVKFRLCKNEVSEAWL